MSPKLRIAIFLHTIRSDWNNGNAHFLRGLARALGTLGHAVTIFEPRDNWSTRNLLEEANGHQSLEQFARIYPDLRVHLYSPEDELPLAGQEIVIVHEWNGPELIASIHQSRHRSGYKTLFHDTHHRASSSPSAIRSLQVEKFDGVLAFGEALRTIYREQWRLPNVWTLHEAADTTVFYPRASTTTTDLVWVGNWGDDERTQELHTYLIDPAARLAHLRFTIYGVRYPRVGLDALAQAGILYGGYLPNLSAPEAYASARLTAHVPRQQYTTAMQGIPTIRVFEALASGIPLISAPWIDAEQLFAPGDYTSVSSTGEMIAAIEHLLADEEARTRQIEQGLRTVRERHTCLHRAQQLSEICQEVLAS